MRDERAGGTAPAPRPRPLFSRRAARRFRRALLGAIVVPMVSVAGLMAGVRMPRTTGVGAEVPQPMPFDHRIHAGGLAIDCQYCHAEASRAATAGLPPTTACVDCHQPAMVASALFAPVRASLAQRAPIAWRRVHQLPDFVYFDHSVHVANGIACASCHGDVPRMGVVRQVAPLTMQWCVQCHRDPGSRAPVNGPVYCSACHR